MIAMALFRPGAVLAEMAAQSTPLQAVVNLTSSLTPPGDFRGRLCFLLWRPGLCWRSVGRCKLHPGLKAPLVSKPQPNEDELAFNLNLVSELAPLQLGVVVMVSDAQPRKPNGAHLSAPLSITGKGEETGARQRQPTSSFKLKLPQF